MIHFARCAPQYEHLWWFCVSVADKGLFVFQLFIILFLLGNAFLASNNMNALIEFNAPIACCLRVCCT